MPTTVLGPFSGKPVKVRDQDLGRAVRDEEGRIFYVLSKSQGGGYYGAPTRAGGAKDEARALELESKTAAARENVHEQVEIIHDATGPGRSSVRGKLVVIFLLLLVVALFILAKFGPWGDMTKSWRPSPAPPSNVHEGRGNPAAP